MCPTAIHFDVVADRPQMQPPAHGFRRRCNVRPGPHRAGRRRPPDTTLARLKPWAGLLKLPERPAGAAGEGATLVHVLLAEARRRRLSIQGIDLPDEQVAAFDAIPLPSQGALTKFVLTGCDALVRDHDAVVAAWLDRDLARLAALNAAPGRRRAEIAPHIAALTRHLVEDRSVLIAYLPARAAAVSRPGVRRRRRAASLRGARAARPAAGAGLRRAPRLPHSGEARRPA